MSKRLTRKQIKEDIRHDEFQEAMTTTFDKILEYKNVIIGVAVGIVVLAAAYSGLRAYLERQERAATNELAQAMKVYGAPIREDGAQPDDPDAPSFVSVEARREKARQELEQVSTGVPGDVADLYLAQLALDEGDTATARERWQSFLDDHEEHVLAVSVRLNLLRLDRHEGRGEEVLAWLEEELEKSNQSLPEEMILFELGETLESLGREADAEAFYQRLLDDYATSIYASKARQKTAS